MPKSRIRLNWAPQPAQSPGRLRELCRQQESWVTPPTHTPSPGGARSPLHPHSAPLFSPLPASQRHLTTRRPGIRTFTGKLDASRSLERRMERRTRWRWGGRRQQDTRLGLGDAGSRGKRSWRYGIRIYRIVMILPLPTRLCPPSLPFADLDHPMAFPQPSINPRALAKFWVEQGYCAQQGKMLPFIRYHSPKTTLKHHQFGNSHLPCSPQARWPASWLQKHPDINVQGDVEENPGEELAYLFLIPADLMQPQPPLHCHVSGSAIYQNGCSLPGARPPRLHTPLSKVLLHLRTQS